jgi:hypothetical protein
VIVAASRKRMSMYITCKSPTSHSQQSVRDLNRRRVPTFDHSRRNPTTRAETIPISTEHRRITPMNNYVVDTSTTFGEITNIPRKEPIEGPDQWGFIVLREQ